MTKWFIGFLSVLVFWTEVGLSDGIHYLKRGDKGVVLSLFDDGSQINIDFRITKASNYTQFSDQLKKIQQDLRAKPAGSRKEFHDLLNSYFPKYGRVSIRRGIFYIRLLAQMDRTLLDEIKSNAAFKSLDPKIQQKYIANTPATMTQYVLERPSGDLISLSELKHAHGEFLKGVKEYTKKVANPSHQESRELKEFKKQVAQLKQNFKAATGMDVLNREKVAGFLIENRVDAAAGQPAANRRYLLQTEGPRIGKKMIQIYDTVDKIREADSKRGYDLYNEVYDQVLYLDNQIARLTLEEAKHGAAGDRLILHSVILQLESCTFLEIASEFLNATFPESFAQADKELQRQISVHKPTKAGSPKSSVYGSFEKLLSFVQSEKGDAPLPPTIPKAPDNVTPVKKSIQRPSKKVSGPVTTPKVKPKKPVPTTNKKRSASQPKKIKRKRPSSSFERARKRRAQRIKNKNKK